MTRSITKFSLFSSFLRMPNYMTFSWKFLSFRVFLNKPSPTQNASAGQKLLLCPFWRFDLEWLLNSRNSLNPDLQMTDLVLSFPLCFPVACANLQTNMKSDYAWIVK